MRISDWSSDVCSSDLADQKAHQPDDRQRIDPDGLKAADDRVPANAAPGADLGREGDEHRAEKADDADELGPDAGTGDAQFFEHARPHRAAIAVDAIVAPVVGTGVQQALRVLARPDDLCAKRAPG